MAVGRGLFGLGSAVEDPTSPCRLPNTLGGGRKACGAPSTVVAAEDVGEDEALRPASGTEGWSVMVVPVSGVSLAPALAGKLTVGPVEQAVAHCDGGGAAIAPTTGGPGKTPAPLPSPSSCDKRSQSICSS